MEERDLVVIGGGPAGYVAAIRAAQLGAKATLVERDALGGTCLNHGCIPTRALLRGVEFLDLAKRARDYGVSWAEVSVDFSKMMARKDIVVRTLVTGVGGLLRGNGVEVLKGAAKLLSPSEIEAEVEGGEVKTLKAKRIILATGAKWKLPPIPGGQGAIITPEDALRFSEVPESMVILGGQEVGFALATIFSRLGTKITILERSPQILADVDGEVVALLERGLKREGIEVFTEAEVAAIEGSDGGKNISAIIKGEPKTFSGHYLLAAQDRVANIQGLGLERIGIMLDDEGIPVNRKMQTNLPIILAAGDVTGRPRLAHVAFAEGKAAAENALGKDTEMDYKVIPRCINTFPPIASVGLTESEALSQGYQVKIGRFPFAANGMATILGERAGFIKIVTDVKYGEMLGVHIMGPQAADLIAEAAVVMKMDGTYQEIGSVLHAHPSLPEALMEAAMDVAGEALHFFPG